MKHLAFSAVFTITVFGTTPVGAAAECPGADLPVTSSAAGARATLCVANEERATVGAKALASNPQLEASAQAYARRLVAERFFSHVAPDGSDFFDRLSRSGYANAQFVAGGENLGWLGGAATPRAMVKAWLGSPAHRANLLDRRLRDSGIGVAIGTPSSAPGVTFVHHLGVRESARVLSPRPKSPPRGRKPRKHKVPSGTPPRRVKRVSR